ncbi:MAG: HPr kinase/phosphorylase [Azonexus sp.]|nr:HPr kinase/phosphorylase [Betaproteobacteria bacterium]MBK8919477.1 HPr kinase/phosphorylase [Betaproteobacteria bacterium]MBL8448723.1 HPr kinase/phosphorylase [Dechloromonas sp.]MBP6037645.1 HPr kinase/phosphorylase [Azonexus sp.]MBP6908154.1 HPr kinase/phosphorylase [Azonexus sp.]
MRHISLDQLYDDNRDKLLLNWVVAHGAERRIELKTSNNYGADVVGHINVIHPERLQVMGLAEYDWVQRIGEAKFRHQFQELLAAQSPAIIVAEGLAPPEALFLACEASGTPLLTTPKPCSAVIDLLRIYLSRRLADTTSLHGVFMDVLGMGVLVTGDSGVGKSELALELISRGHGLVADDVVEMARIAPATIEGRCPGMLRDFLEVRGLGLLNIRTIFGETASRRKMKLKLIVHLQRPAQGMEAPRLPLDAQSQEVLGVPIRKVVIPVAAGRNLAVLLEAAVRNTILQLRGIDSMQDFIERQQRIMLDEDA